MKSVLSRQWSLAQRSLSPRFLSFVVAASASLAVQARAQDAPAPAAGSTQEAQPQDAKQDDVQARVRYLVAGANGAKARNLPDAGAQTVLDVAAGSVVAVYGERAGWSEVEAPGGFQVWVFGEYVKPTSEVGVLEVAASGVNQRPTASSGAEAYPLKPTLARGARVRFVKRQDETKPLAEDWIQVYSAPGTRAWVANGELTALASGQDGAKLWAKAIVEASQRPSLAVPGASLALAAAKPGAKSDAKTDGKDAAKPTDANSDDQTVKAAPDKAREMIRSADKKLDGERARLKTGERPDFASVRKLYEEAVLYAGADKDLGDTLKNRLAEVDTLADAYALRQEMESKLAETETAKRDRDRKVKEAAAVKDVFAGRFEARGWVEKVTFAGQSASYRVRYGGEVVAEIVCNSGRYDLDVFLNHDVGVNGLELRRAQPGATGIATQPRVIDARRIEVIAGRASR
ncbi:MAG: hypothetical protein HZA52_20050 [Planctomycetes bacterium]|nr:hypothetical protein [Planctomycetota bacterium]